MAKQPNISTDYLKGFNQGYQFAKEIPNFNAKSIKNMPKSIQKKPRIQGVIDGVRQFHQERYLSKVKARMPKLKQNITPNKGLSRN